MAHSPRRFGRSAAGCTFVSVALESILLERHDADILATLRTQVSASKLQTGYVGQAGKATEEAFKSAKGGVLFIDEARALNCLGRRTCSSPLINVYTRCSNLDYEEHVLFIGACT